MSCQLNDTKKYKRSSEVDRLFKMFTTTKFTAPFKSKLPICITPIMIINQNGKLEYSL